MKSLRSYLYRAADAVGLFNLNVLLVVAASEGKTKRVQALLEAGVDVHAWKEWAEEHGHAETARVLKDGMARNARKPSPPDDAPAKTPWQVGDVMNARRPNAGWINMVPIKNAE